MQDDPGASPAPTPPPPLPDPRQRWRLTVARDPAAAPEGQTQRDLAEAWEATILAAGLPVARQGTRPRIAFGAPLPVGATAEAELIDVILTERWPAWRVREAVSAHVPAGWRLVGAADEWLAGPALPGLVVAADYLVALDPSADPAVVARLPEVARTLLAARKVARERLKGGQVVTYDLRPLVDDVRLVDVGPPATIRTRTRFDAALGTGRPEEVVAALGEIAGAELPIASITRERLVLRGDEDA